MSFAEIISLVALIISLASLAATLYFNLRDRASVVAKSTYYPGYEGGIPSVAIHIVNSGRRPIVMYQWVGAGKAHEWVGTYLNQKDKNSGYRLAEHERYELSIRRDDLVALTPDEDFIIENIWFEDTLGRRYFVEGARENIIKLAGSVKNCRDLLCPVESP